MEDSPAAWVTLGAALLGAGVGGAASLAASIVVDRLRLRREMRVRIYDEYIGEATGPLARWYQKSKDGLVDMESYEVLAALAQIRRASIIASKADRRKTKQWEDAHRALAGLDTKLHTLSSGPHSSDRDQLLGEVVTHTHTVITGLNDYSEWLGKKLA